MMKTALITVALVTALLSLISAATPDLKASEQATTGPGWQPEHRTGEPASSPATPLPTELEQLRAALDSNREELLWVQELLQQAGETLYWAQTRHRQSAVAQRALEDQLGAMMAAYEARQVQVAQLAGELKAVKASRSANNWQAGDSQADIQTLKNERDQLRYALAERDRRLAVMEEELQTARADLQQAQAETVAANQQRSTAHRQDQSCQARHTALNDELTGLRQSETDARQSLVKANTARYHLQTELAACSENLIQAKASFASMEAAAGPPSTTRAGADALPEAEPVATGRVDSPPEDSAADKPTDSPISLQGVKFRYDSSELTDESRAILDQVAAVLRGQPQARHEVAGHTDSQGNPAYNEWLSQRRANTVRKYLIAHGVDASKLVARGYGGVQPIADNSTWAGLTRNRRVELREIH